ncbi:MAG: putative nucleotidyltransferase MJ0435 [Methanophagales archaeon]|nr:putative nucleotidyltransferase MJ0435 [Methanophagales archaeon]
MKENMMQIGEDEKEEKKRIEERKKNALKYFKERLLKSEAGDLIAKIVLFGSVARGEAGEESDIDVLVFALGDLRKVREACAEASLWTSIETGESVQPLVYSIDELRFPSFFIYKSVREGEVVFEMEEGRDAKKGSGGIFRFS